MHRFRKYLNVAGYYIEGLTKFAGYESFLRSDWRCSPQVKHPIYIYFHGLIKSPSALCENCRWGEIGNETWGLNSADFKKKRDGFGFKKNRDSMTLTFKKSGCYHGGPHPWGSKQVI
jgi:hypothetical protein